MGVEEVKTEDMAAEKVVFGEDAKFSQLVGRYVYARHMNYFKISLLYSVSSIPLSYFDVADTLGHGTGAVDEVNEGFVVGVDRTTRSEVR